MSPELHLFLIGAILATMIALSFQLGCIIGAHRERNGKPGMLMFGKWM